MRKMHDESTFLQAMQQHPDDTALRLVFADWLEERGDPRGELIRLLHTLTPSVEVPDRSRLEDRLRSLLASGVQPVGPFWTNSIGMKFAWIPAGTFLMGSPVDEKEREENEIQHKVTLTKGFWLAIHPMTQAAWKEVMGNNLSHFQGDNLPVEQVSWDDCLEFCRKLSERESRAYRLPSEAEWENACRAGTTTPFSVGDTLSTDQANFRPYGKGTQGVRLRTTAVGSFLPNGFGLHDMHGNVCEWCADWFGHYPSGAVVDPQGSPDGICRVLRGGSFSHVASFARCANRDDDVPGYHNRRFGFRPARTFP